MSSLPYSHSIHRYGVYEGFPNDCQDVQRDDRQDSETAAICAHRVGRNLKYGETVELDIGLLRADRSIRLYAHV